MERALLALVLVHMASVFGIITNLVAVLTIRKCVNLHSSFGILCACLAANNSFVLLLNSSWYTMPNTDFYRAGATLSRYTGMLGFISWIFGIRIHMLISINRLVSIIFPFVSQRHITARNTWIAVIIAMLATIAHCAPLVLVDDTWFCYDPSTMRWLFAPTERGRFYEFNLSYKSHAFDFTVVFLLDTITLLYLRFVYNKSKNKISFATNKETRTREIRLFRQAFSQSVPLILTYCSFAYVTPLSDDHFHKFVSTTLVWHIAHGLDGLIINIYHFRLDLFKKKKGIALPASKLGGNSYITFASTQMRNVNEHNFAGR